MAELDRVRERVRRLEAVVEASLLVNSTLDLQELAEFIVDIATRLIDAERGSLFLVEDGTLRAMVAQGLPRAPLLLKVGEGIVGRVAATGEAILLDDPYADDRFDPGVDRVTGYRTRSLLTVAVRDRGGTLVAVLQLLNHRGAGFTAADVDFLSELGVPFAIALTTARLHQEIVERERVQEELRLAAEIQKTLQPRDLTSVPGLELVSLARPCQEVGGDYYDLIPSSDGERWWMVVADISGKGVSAGLIASNVQAFMWSRRDDRRPLELVVADANELLYGLTRGRKFATLAVAEWRADDRSVTWVSAGHPPILLREGAAVREIEATGRPIGLLPGQVYDRVGARLGPGDLFLMYTDGVVEAGMAQASGEFGFDRLRSCIRPDATARDVVATVSREVRLHLGDAAPDDDITILGAATT
jgi:sigma-B regulation protein RsbU (phosphoserine phosphatase)